MNQKYKQITPPQKPLRKKSLCGSQTQRELTTTQKQSISKSYYTIHDCSKHKKHKIPAWQFSWIKFKGAKDMEAQNRYLVEMLNNLKL
ncbi:hypothetical protein pb186bvf_017599 [Paramecium bursaria]